MRLPAPPQGTYLCVMWFIAHNLQRQALCTLTRRFQTLYEMFDDLSAGKRDPRASTGRLPVLLLLGGGMAAGKSTVREIIGHDDFWSKARLMH